MEIIDLTSLLPVVGLLVIVTNVIVQVLKNATNFKFHTNILAVIVSIVLTLGAFVAYCQIKGIVILWYMIAAAVVLGFFVAYAAMFGYDKLIEVIRQQKKA